MPGDAWGCPGGLAGRVWATHIYTQYIYIYMHIQTHIGVCMYNVLKSNADLKPGPVWVSGWVGGWVSDGE